MLESVVTESSGAGSVVASNGSSLCRPSAEGRFAPRGFLPERRTSVRPPFGGKREYYKRGGCPELI